MAWGAKSRDRERSSLKKRVLKSVAITFIFLLLAFVWLGFSYLDEQLDVQQHELTHAAHLSYFGCDKVRIALGNISTPWLENGNAKGATWCKNWGRNLTAAEMLEETRLSAETDIALSNQVANSNLVYESGMMILIGIWAYLALIRQFIENA